MEIFREYLGENRELIGFFEEFFGRERSEKLFLFWQGIARKHTIRINTLKIASEQLIKRLEAQGFKLRALKFYEDAYEVMEAPFEIGNTLEHFLGYFYVQSASSMLPPLILRPQPHETVLDLAAAPGSKTTQMAQMMKNTGVILANDIDYDRLKALSNNIDRLGVLNTIITYGEGYKIGFIYRERFDKVLIDAPCSALGTLYKSTEIKKWWSFKKVRRLTRTQKGLILAGFKALKPGGVMVYSTCTFVPWENEMVVDFLLKREPEAEVLEIDELPQTLNYEPGLVRYREQEFSPEIAKTIRVYPGGEFEEGFYIALIRKKG